MSDDCEDPGVTADKCEDESSDDESKDEPKEPKVPGVPFSAAGGGAAEGGVEGEDEDALTDLQAQYRTACAATKECASLAQALQSCNLRVTGKTKTTETCMEEIIDFVNCVDHCASKKFFPLLK